MHEDDLFAVVLTSVYPDLHGEFRPSSAAVLARRRTSLPNMNTSQKTATTPPLLPRVDEAPVQPTSSFRPNPPPSFPTPSFSPPSETTSTPYRPTNGWSYSAIPPRPATNGYANHIDGADAEEPSKADEFSRGIRERQEFSAMDLESRGISHAASGDSESAGGLMRSASMDRCVMHGVCLRNLLVFSVLTLS